MHKNLFLIYLFIQLHMFKIYPINMSDIQSHVAVGDKTKYMSCIIPHVALNVIPKCISHKIAPILRLSLITTNLFFHTARYKSTFFSDSFYYAIYW